MFGSHSSDCGVVSEQKIPVAFDPKYFVRRGGQLTHRCSLAVTTRLGVGWRTICSPRRKKRRGRSKGDGVFVACGLTEGTDRFPSILSQLGKSMLR